MKTSNDSTNLGLTTKNNSNSKNKKVFKKSEDNSDKNKQINYHFNKHVKMMKNAGNKNLEEHSIKASVTATNELALNSKNKKHKKERKLHIPIKMFEKSNTKEKTASDSNEFLQKKNPNHEGKLIKNKKKMLDSTIEKYKPGMLSDSIQIKKYGRVVIPWDPSFGLDESFKIPVNGREDFPNVKINPLFDLSKRKETATQPLGEKTQRTVFLGNLPNDIQLSEIKKLFRKCGLVHKIKIKERKVKLTKGSTHETRIHKNAFITFKQAESCEKALKLNGRLFKDCHLRVDMAQNTCNPETTRSVFVGNLHFKAEDEVLWKAFKRCGNIEGVRIIRDDSTGLGKGYGYVNFKKEEAVEKALALDGLSILDRNIRVRRNSVGELELPNSNVKRKRGKKKNKKKLQSTDNIEENEPKKENAQKSDQKEPKIEIELKQKKIKNHKHKLMNSVNDEPNCKVTHKRNKNSEMMDSLNPKLSKMPRKKKKSMSLKKEKS